MNLELAGKSALVTGAHRGTGTIIAHQLAAEGARVWLHGFTASEAETAARTIDNAYPVSGDITTDAGAAEVINAVKIHPPSILVNNYGTTVKGDWETLDTQTWLDAYQKNLLSAQRLIQGLVPNMRKSGWGRIINLGTVGSTRPNATMPHYYAAKAALANMTVSLAKTVGRDGVGVNLVSPGLILTPEVEAAYLRRGEREGWGATWKEIEPHIAKEIPIGRITRREEVADLVCFLASPRTDAIHGQNIRIDGGSVDIVS